MKMKLVVDDVEVNVGVDFLRCIVNCMPNSPEYHELAHSFAKSNDSNIRSDIAYRENIPEETASLLVDDDDPMVLERILDNPVASPIVKLDRIKAIINTSGSEVINIIIDNIDQYDQVDALVIGEMIYELDKSQFHLELAQSWGAPKSLLNRLSESDDPDIRNTAKTSLERDYPMPPTKKIRI